MPAFVSQEAKKRKELKINFSMLDNLCGFEGNFTFETASVFFSIVLLY
jgi:hypothetical protein